VAMGRGGGRVHRPCRMPHTRPPPHLFIPHPPCLTGLFPRQGELGDKKRRKALSALKESDVALIVVDCSKHAAAALSGAPLAPAALKWEAQLLEGAAKYGAVPLLMFNLKRGAWPAAAAAARAQPGAAGCGGLAPAEAAVVAALRRALDPAGEAAWTALDLASDGAHGGGSASGGVADRVAAFVQGGVAASKGRNSARSLPDWALTPDSAVFLNIPVGGLGGGVGVVAAETVAAPCHAEGRQAGAFARGRRK
jgi:hypothetical protein